MAMPSVTNGCSAADWEKRRAELVQIMAQEEYGVSPKAPEWLKSEVTAHFDGAYADKAVLDTIQLTFPAEIGNFEFPMTLLIPKSEEKVPVFIHINYQRAVGGDYMPAEEIIDNGFALAQFDYKDITADGPEIDGLAALYTPDPEYGIGKIGYWAFAVSRIVDYLLTRPEIDPDRIAVIGHSRLGKTALWAGTQDTRIALTISNDSGCSGAGMHRVIKDKENVDGITRNFPFWFGNKYHTYAGRIEEMPFDQHFAMGAIAPRHLIVGTDIGDQWADSNAEYAGVVAASEAWELLGQKGLVTDDPTTCPAPGTKLLEGDAAFEIRHGTHFLSRTDWNIYMEYRKLHNV